MAASQAVENNQKLFRRYAKMFALSDPDVYISHAEKLSIWLNDSKAYYMTARPEIVKLLLIAQMTLRRSFGLAEHLNSAFNIWEYSEHPMVKSYTKLVKTVQPFENYFTEPSLLAHIRSLLASVSPPQAPGDAQKSLTHHVSETQSTVPSSNIMTSSAPNILPVTAKAQVKTKKRKAVDFELLVQRDIKALLEKKGNQGDQKVVAPDQTTESLPSQNLNTTTETPGTSSPAFEDQIMAAPNQIMQPLPSHDTSLVTETQGTSSQAVIEDQEMAPPDSSREPSTPAHVIEPQDRASQSVTEDQEMAAPDTADAPLPSEDAGVAAEPQGSSWQPITEEEEKQEITAGDSENSGPLPSKGAGAAIETQELAATLISEESVTTFLQPPLQSQTRNITPPVSSDRLGNISPVQDVRSSILPASVDNLVKSSPHSPMPGKFGQEMRIVAVVTGLSKECTISFACTISSSLFSKVSAWLNRNNISSNIEHSLCLSLGCYSIADLRERSIKNKCTTLEQQTSVARSYWPQKGGLTMNVQFKNGREDLPLSPPFQVTPDGFVDVSQFLLAGENLIKLTQTTNMSQYIFVLHSHYPTRAQLQELDGRRQRESEWQEWVRHVSKPFDIPLKPILQT